MRNKLAWLWNSLGNFVTIAGWITGSALLAWGVKVAGVFVEYQPLSWIMAGFFGALLGGVAILLVGIGQSLSVKAKARRLLIREGDAIDPMLTIFQNKRIYIADLVNPFEQVVKGKKFINCELIGPANVIPLLGVGKFNGNYFSHSDTVEIRTGAVPNNAIAWMDCDFENCRFYKVTLLFFDQYRENADKMIVGMNWLNGPEVAPNTGGGLPAEQPIAARVKRWFANE